MFHEEYRERPYWWDAYEPSSPDLLDLPSSCSVAIIGAGYAGLATALELSKQGIDSVVLDENDAGYGASTRSGGLVGGSAAVKKPLVGRAPDAAYTATAMQEGVDSLRHVERLIREEKIDCGWSLTGRFTGAWSPRHLQAMKTKAEALNRHSQAGAFVVTREQQREQIGSDFYHGGLVTPDAAHLHPARYFQGLMRACEQRNIPICTHAGVQTLARANDRWSLTTTRGVVLADQVVIATNGYTGDVTPQFKRRLVPLKAYIIATEELPADLARSLSPLDRSFSDSKRIVTFSRLSSDKRRMILGSRVKWRDITATEMAPLLRAIMVERFPMLADAKITHAWNGNVALTLDERPHLGVMDGLHYALGCNGTGIAPMTYMGTKLARKIAGTSNSGSAFEKGPFPDHPLYSGGTNWFLPLIGSYFRVRDWWDRKAG